MKKVISMFVAVALLFSCVIGITPTVHAATKANQTRSIAIVFDNSGSMYFASKNKSIPDWSRATYAMEVFASMLNKGDTLTIYPMWPIEVEGKTYSTESPLKITNSSQASKIREIYTPNAKGTPIASIDSAAAGLKSTTADKKYLVVLTDGDSFDGKSEKETIKALDSRFNDLATADMTVMYLGVGEQAVMPSKAESDYFAKKHAKNSEDVLKHLTTMCNKIFGRDELKNDGKTINFDISMNKVIVFVQGKDITNLKVTDSNGKEMGKVENTASTSYSKNGGVGESFVGNKKSDPDTSLQGMMVTYTDCAKGKYNIKFDGNETSVAVYYEPNIDLAFVFTDEDGNEVDPNELYEGKYKVSFGMKDGKTGKLIEEDKAKLLGTPKYEGSYFIKGEEHKFTGEGLNGEVEITLGLGEKFEANLTATYLKDYTIRKDSTDFGWPKGGITVVAMPAGKLKLDISGGEKVYSLQSLEKGSPYIVKVYYQGKQLTGEELNEVMLAWDEDSSNAAIKPEFADDHYKLSLTYKNPDSPKDTVCGKCSVSLEAFYTAQGSEEAKAKRPLSYYIDEDKSDFNISVIVNQDYIVIDELEQSEEIEVKLYINGEPLTAEQFARIKLDVDSGKIKHTLNPDENNSSYLIKFNSTDGLDEGDYQIKISATYTDVVGRKSTADDSETITLSNTPLWLKWLIRIIIFIILFIIIWKILHIKVLPKHIREDHDGCSLSVGGQTRTNDAGTVLFAKRTGKSVQVVASFQNKECRVSISGIVPGPDSYLYKKSVNRSFTVDPQKINVSGKVTYLDIDGVTYNADNRNNLVLQDEDQGPFTVTNDTTVSLKGTININGKPKNINSDILMTFRKRN